MVSTPALWLTAPLPTDLHSIEGVLALEAQLFELPQVTPILLMKRAGRCAMEALLQLWPKPEKITVYCGSGNNGGDGYIVAALAEARCIPVSVVQLGEPSTDTAKRAYEYALAEAVEIEPFGEHQAPTEGVIVDAIFGIGLNRSIEGTAKTAIHEINQNPLPTYSLDIPSGLCADTGKVLGSAVTAAATTTFIGLKSGLLTPQGQHRCGKLLCALPETLLREVSLAPIKPVAPVATRIAAEQLPSLKPRPIHAHKGHFGHTMVIGGDHGMGGAVLLASQSAARTGSGLTSIASRAEHVAASLVRAPEVMANGVDSGQELEPLLEKPTHLVVGPGLGENAWSLQMLQRVLMANKPTVFDADALNILANQHRLSLQTHKATKVITPHPGEAARLLGISTTDVENNRFAVARQLREQLDATVVLKGAGTIVATTDESHLANLSGNDAEKNITNRLWLCSNGNPGMASGGMGDVLAGIIGSLMAQGMSSNQAALWGVLIHAQAGDRLARTHGQRGLQASDLIPQVRECFHQLENLND